MCLQAESSVFGPPFSQGKVCGAFTNNQQSHPLAVMAGDVFSGTGLTFAAHATWPFKVYNLRQAGDGEFES